MRFQALFTDIDGTAVASEPRNQIVIEDLTRAGGYEIKPEDWDDLVGSGDEFIWLGICKKHPDFVKTYPSADAFEQACADEYARRLDEIELHEPVRDIVVEFIQNSRDVAAVTNAITRTGIDNLRHTGYPLDDMAFVLGKDDVKNAGRKIKPDGDHYLYALELLNGQRAAANKPPLAPEDCLVLEDTQTGVRAALRAGMTVIQITDSTNALPDEEAKDLMALYGGSYYTTTLSDIQPLARTLDRSPPPRGRGRRLTP